MTQRDANKHIKEIKRIGLREWANNRGLSTYAIASGLSIKGVELSRNNVQAWCGTGRIPPLGLIAIHGALCRGDL